MASSRACPICRNPTDLAGRKCGSRTQREFTLRRCHDCGFAFVEDPWTDYAQIYDQAYYQGQGSDPLVDYAFEFAHPTKTIRQYEWRGVARAVTRQAPPPVKWLDFGCGNGGLIRYLRDHGHERVFGFDTGAWSEKARQAGLPILKESDLSSHRGTFDVLTAVEVIEHVVDPMALLRHWRALVKPGGLLFLTTGNADKAPKDFLSWSYVQPEIHVSYFTPRAMALALRQTGFEPLFPGRTAGWTDIIRFKILKNLRVRNANLIEQILPWPLLVWLADGRYQISAYPIGRAI